MADIGKYNTLSVVAVTEKGAYMAVDSWKLDLRPT